MDEVNLEQFIKVAKESMLKVGELAISCQDDVVNLGKNIEILQNDTPILQEERAAKTIIDEKVQEWILTEFLKILDVKNVKLDAEEDTPTTKLFTTRKAPFTLVIDPIDGTLEYIKRHDTYSICVCLIYLEEILTALVYFPKRRVLYFIDKNKKAYMSVYSDKLELKETELLKAPKYIAKSIYRNHRVPQDIANCLEATGYKVQDDAIDRALWPEALLKCIKGEYKVCLFRASEIRDLLLGAIIEKIDSGYAVDWEGNKLKWPNGGRIDKVIFGFGNPEKEIIECLMGEG